MTQKEKLVSKFLQNPTSLRYIQIVTVLEDHGFFQVQAKGSHVKFKHPKLDYDLTIPIHNKDCKDFYKQQAKKFLEKVT